MFRDVAGVCLETLQRATSEEHGVSEAREALEPGAEQLGRASAAVGLLAVIGRARQHEHA